MASYIPFINYDNCYGCKVCLYNCPVSLFTLAHPVTRRGMRRELPATTYIERCIGCGVCARMCPVEAIDMLKNPPGEGEPVYIDWDKPVRIDPNKCKGCTACGRACPASAIEGKAKVPHVIHEDQCIRCGVCMEKCNFGAIYNSDDPVPEYVAPEPKKEEPKAAPSGDGKFVIDPEKCKGCTACARVCPAEAISGEVKQPHSIDKEKCLACGACAEKCKFGAISQEGAAPKAEPEKEEPKAAPAVAPVPQEKIEGKYSIDPEKCKGCTACARVCPAEAISGEVKQPHVIDQEACLGCGSCMEKCKFEAISAN